MNIVVAIIFSVLMLNCRQQLNMMSDDKNKFAYFDDLKLNNEYNNNLIDKFGDYLEFDTEEATINFLNSIKNPEVVFNKLYLDKEGNKEGFIHYAVDLGSLDIIKRIIDVGGEELVNFPNYEGVTPLHLAALRGDLDIIKYFLGKKADIKHLDNNGASVFHRAAQSGSAEALKYLLDINDAAGSNKIDLLKIVTTDDNSTLLHWAVICDSKLLLEYLLNNNPGEDFINKRGGKKSLTALELAYRGWGSDELIKELEQHTKILSDNKE